MSRLLPSSCRMANTLAPAIAPGQAAGARPPSLLVSSKAPSGALPTAPACVRAHVKTTLTGWHLAALTDTAEPVASELVTNAVRASTDERGHPKYWNGHMAIIVVRLLADHTRLVLEVWDMADGVPAARHVTADDECGRGLDLVEAATTSWGTRPLLAGPANASGRNCESYG
jgi:hypothetical protein